MDASGLESKPVAASAMPPAIARWNHSLPPVNRVGRVAYDTGLKAGKRMVERMKSFGALLADARRAVSLHVSAGNTVMKHG